MRDSTASPQPRVLIVEGDHRVRRSLAGFIMARCAIELVATASAAGDALGYVERERPDIVLVDLDRPDADTCLDLMAQIRARGTPCAVIAVSFAAPLRAVALAAGADAFVVKTEPDKFCEAIESIRRSRPDRPPTVAAVPSIEGGASSS